MGSTSSHPTRPQIIHCTDGSSEGPQKMKPANRFLFDSQYFMQCVSAGRNTSPAHIEGLPPMPSDMVLNQRFNKFLASIDLPADKERMLKSYSDEQKWDIICALERLTPRDQPSHYLSALQAYLDSKATRYEKKRWRGMNISTSEVLSHLEISLRTNTIQWVEEFLGESKEGFEALVQYFKMRVEMLIEERTEGDAHREGLDIANRAGETSSISHGLSPSSTQSELNVVVVGSDTQLSSSIVRKFNNPPRQQQLRNFHRFKVGKSTTDVHICLLCLRAIMNSKFGFGLVIQHHEAINVMVLSLFHKFLRTRALILNLLTAICMVKGSHKMVVAAFDNFKAISQERHRFETLLQHFVKYKTFHMEYMVSCMKFINVFVHSVEQLNHRVHLQYEFTALGLDVFLDQLRHTESEELKAEIEAYRANFVDVSAHMKTTGMNAAANERIRELEESLAREVEHNNELKHKAERLEAMSREQVELAKRAAPMSELALKMPKYVQVLPTAYNTNEDGLPPIEITQLDATKKTREKPFPPPKSPRKTKNVVGNPMPSPSPPLADIIPMSPIQPTCGITSSLSPTHNASTTPAAGPTFAPSFECGKPPSLPASNIPTQPEDGTVAATQPDGHIAQTPAPSGTTPVAPTPPSATNFATHPPHGKIPIPQKARKIPKPPPVWNIPMVPSTGTVPIPPPLPKSNSIPIPPPLPSDCNIPGPPVCATAGAIPIKNKVQTKHKLPTLNWVALRPYQVRGTIFNDLDDERVYKEIDFTEFEERFQIGSLVPSDTKLKADSFDRHPLKHIQKEGTITLMSSNRQRNVAISRRRLRKTANELIAAINDFDLEQLSLENVELLLKLVPTEVEVKAYNEYIAKRKDVAQLSDDDHFMLQLSKTERISTKLAIMNYMGNFSALMELLQPQILAVTAAATSLKHSAKFKDILAILLAFGNYMNSSKRGPAYGFKLQSFDALMDTKSCDKRMSLLHFIVATVRQKYPHLLDFDVELKDIDKAAQVWLENVATDVEEADKGMKLIKDELEVRTRTKSTSQILREFVSTSEDKLKQMMLDLKAAQDAFKDCLEYFAESSRTSNTSTFFTLVARFVRCFKACDAENELRRSQEQAGAQGAAKKFSTHSLSRRNHNVQHSFMNELKLKTDSIAKRKLLNPHEICDGTFEDLIEGLKSEPFLRLDGAQTSRCFRSHDELERNEKL